MFRTRFFSKTSCKITVTIILIFVTSFVLATEYANFDCIYTPEISIGPWGWSFIILGTIGAAALAFFTGGASVPAWMATVGTWIGGTVGLSGAAATSYGLALLGGGSIAAGGLGVAGGVAVLAAAFSFGTDIVISYGFEKALQVWEQKQFVTDSKKMFTLPLPRNQKGGDAYEETLAFLKKNLVLDKGNDMFSPKNQQILSTAIGMQLATMTKEKDKDYIVKDKTLLAILYFQTGDYSKSLIQAKEAFDLAVQNNNKATVPAFLAATCYLYSENTDGAAIAKSQENVLSYAFVYESDNKLIPLMWAIYLDRVMYRYHLDNFDINNLKYLIEIMRNHELEMHMPESISILTARCMVELKRTQQDIKIVANNRNSEFILSHPETVAVIRRRLAAYKELVGLLKYNILPELNIVNTRLPKNSEVRYERVSALVDAYDKDTVIIEKQVVDFETAVAEYGRNKFIVLLAVGGGLGLIVFLAVGGRLYLKTRRKIN